MKLGHGVTIVVPEKGKETREWVVIGTRPMPGVRYVLWAHPAGDPGARPIRYGVVSAWRTGEETPADSRTHTHTHTHSLRKLKKATLKNAPPTAVVEEKKENHENAEDDVCVPVCCCGTLR